MLCRATTQCGSHTYGQVDVARRALTYDSATPRALLFISLLSFHDILTRLLSVVGVGVLECACRTGTSYRYVVRANPSEAWTSQGTPWILMKHQCYMLLVQSRVKFGNCSYPGKPSRILPRQPACLTTCCAPASSRYEA